MMFLLNLLVQVWAVVAGIIVMFQDGFLTGAGLIAIVLALHHLFTAMSKGAMYLHQKTLRVDELRYMAIEAQFGSTEEATPRAWKIIAWIFGLLFFAIANLIILWFLMN